MHWCHFHFHITAKVDRETFSINTWLNVSERVQLSLIVKSVFCCCVVCGSQLFLHLVTYGKLQEKEENLHTNVLIFVWYCH